MKNNYYSIPSSRNEKLLVKGFDKDIIYQLYRPTSKMAKLYFRLRFYYLSVVCFRKKIEEELQEILNLEYVYAILKGNDPKRQKYIALECCDSRSTFKKYAKKGSKGAADIKSEYNNLLAFKNYSHKLFIIPKVVSFEEGQKFVCMETEAHYHSDDLCGENIDYKFLSAYSAAFQSDYKIQRVKVNELLVKSKKVNKSLLKLTNLVRNKDFLEIKYSFSHGDFTPWNVKKSQDKYLLLDWEYCDKRPVLFDIIHYQYSYSSLVKNFDQTQTVNILIEGFQKINVHFTHNDYLIALIFYLRSLYIRKKITKKDFKFFLKSIYNTTVKNNK